MTNAPDAQVRIDCRPVQEIKPLGELKRFEGLAYSRPGRLLAVAAPEDDSILVFRRRPDGFFEDEPYCRIGGVIYPHDVTFAMCGNEEYLATAQRGGVVTLYGKVRGTDSYSSTPVFALSGPGARLAWSDGVACVPPDSRYLAVCNLELQTVTFHRKLSDQPVRFEIAPDFEITRSLMNPDGLGFSEDGRWLAVANHGNRTVSVFERRMDTRSGGAFEYSEEPVAVIEDETLMYPHSVAFMPRTRHLVVTNAGANYFNVYLNESSSHGLKLSHTPALRVAATDEDTFHEVQAYSQMEGGPKGIATFQDEIAICSPQLGIRIYKVREARGALVS